MNTILYQIFTAIILIQFQTLIASSQHQLSQQNPQSLLTTQECLDKRGKSYTKQIYPDGTIKVTFHKSGDIHIKNKEKHLNIYKKSKSRIDNKLIPSTITEYNKLGDVDHEYEIDCKIKNSYKLTSLHDDRLIDALTGEIIP